MITDCFFYTIKKIILLPICSVGEQEKLGCTFSSDFICDSIRHGKLTDDLCWMWQSTLARWPGGSRECKLHIMLQMTIKLPTKKKIYRL